MQYINTMMLFTTFETKIDKETVNLLQGPISKHMRTSSVDTLDYHPFQILRVAPYEFLLSDLHEEKHF